MVWTITHTQDEGSWLDDLINDVIAHELPPLPSHDVKIGHVEAHWHQVAPGIAFVAANPETGTADDRRLVEAVVMEELRTHGFKRAAYDMYSRDLVKESTWADIQEKAKRIIQSGGVTLLRNGYNSVIAQVRGEGTDNGGKPDWHKVELSRDDPDSQALTGQFCDCDWGNFMNLPRTRNWKRFQNRSCAHCLATYWVSRSVPVDETRAPGDQGEEGQMSLPGADMSGGQPAPSMGIMQNSPGPNPNSWFMQPGAPPNQWNSPQGPQMSPQQGQAPPPEQVLPQFPMGEQMEMQLPPVNPASVPGGRPGPTPTNPIQYPGGTFSSVRYAEQQYGNGQLVRLKQETVGQYEGRPESGMAGQSATIPAGSVGEVLGTDPTTQMINVLFMGKQFNQFGPLEPYGATIWAWPSELTISNNKPPGPAIRRT